MLIDQAKITVASGKGGDGGKFFDIMRKPSGGNGGTGGTVAFLGNENIYDLRAFKYEPLYQAGEGSPGGSNNKVGRRGANITLEVPLATEVYDQDTGELLLRISKHRQKEVLLKGGRGGLGNHFFRKKQITGREMTTKGVPSEKLNLHLQLKLMADVIFIGFPNAGKSSMLSELTNAKAQVAAYEFTTIDPQLGDLDGIKLLDLPGLIEGTLNEKGLGTRFLPHTQNALLVAHFISLQQPDLKEAYRKIRLELETVSQRLAEMPEIIVLTKSDEYPDYQKAIKDMQKITGAKVFATSVLDEESLATLASAIKAQVTELKASEIVEQDAATLDTSEQDLQ